MKLIHSLTKQLHSSAVLLSKHKKYFLSAVVLDALFFVLIVVLFQYFYDALLDELVTITDVLAQQSVAQLPGSTGTSPDFYQSYAQIIKLFVLFFFSVFFVYIGAQGTSWFLAYSIIKKISFKHYLYRFFIVNTVWAIVFVILSFVAIRVSYANVVALGSFVNQHVVTVLFAVVYLLLSYFVVVLYSLLVVADVRTALRRCFVFRKEIAVGYVLVFIAVALFTGGLQMSITHDSFLGVIVSFFGLLMVMGLGRVLMIRIVNSVKT